jgi:methyl-accepting chemotaxis protein
MFSRATTLNLIAALIAIALSLMMGFFLSRAITVPLDRCVKMIQEMSLGHLKNRLNIRAKDEVGVLAQNMDRFADELQNVVIGTMKKISDGDLSSQIVAKDSRDEISPALQGTIANLKALIADANLLCQAALDGDLSRRANANSHKGDYRKVIQGFNETLDAVIGPINEAALVLEQVAKRDLTVRVKGDYAGDHAKIKESINSAVDNLDKGLIQVAQNTQTLASASEELSTIGHEMSQNAEKNSSQSNVVSAAAEQVSTNIRMVAAAAEQLNASIKEIAKNAAEAALVAEHAVQSIETTNVTVSKLGDSSAEIGNVVKVITSIAQQTNLLALNATIEAARAGEAGKGFAVVANEVKELAKETAKATEDISLKIETIQGDTKAAVSAISEISGIIKQINEFQASIASAVEEQSATTNEIGRNVTEAAKGSTDIAENITGVAQTARNTASGASDSQKASAELSNLAVGLQKLVAQFKY